MAYSPKGHAVHPPPELKEVQAAAALWSCDAREALARLVKQRDKVLEAEKADPLRYGWEPPIWKVADALLGLPCYDQEFLKALKARMGLDWTGWCRGIRAKLGYRRAVSLLLILGANRASKTEYAAKRSQEIANRNPESLVLAFHMSETRSKKNHQTLFWKYMPPELKVQSKTANEYISYKRHTGFSQNAFILPNDSEAEFRNYKQDRDTAIEGLEADWVWMDELVPPDWVETVLFRLATRHGRGVVTFTPIRGYSPTVKLFCDGAEVVRESIAYLLPKDGGDSDLPRALGLTDAEFKEIEEAEEERRAAYAPQSRPEDCLAWLEEDTETKATSRTEGVRMPFGYANAQPAEPKGRLFHRIERVLRPVDPELGVIFFHGCDSPYGNPKGVFEKAKGKGFEQIRIRCYGKADRETSNVFARFNVNVHRVEDTAIPPQGENIMLVDPAGDRNFYMLWMRSTEHHDYAYREWPSGYEIPGEGVPDPWAKPTGRKEGINDGAWAGGALTFGWGLQRYKFEIARLEGWVDFERWLRDAGGPDRSEAWRAVLNRELYPQEDELLEWDETNGARELMALRIVDSRAASNPRVEQDRPVTLYEELHDLGMEFDLATGASIDDGIEAVNTALDYEENEDGQITTAPRLLVARSCVNLIFCMSNWMNVDGQRGPTKDPNDLLRYYYTREKDDLTGGSVQARGGMHYGRGNRSHDRLRQPKETERRNEAGQIVHRRRPRCMDRKAVFAGR